MYRAPDRAGVKMELSEAVRLCNEPARHPKQVCYDFKTGIFGVVNRNASPRNMMTFCGCTEKEIARTIKAHIEHPEWEREVNYS